MKPSLLFIAVGLVGAIFLGGCASSNQHGGQPSSKDHGFWSKAPTLGMTQGQVLAQYGRPKSTVKTPKGEVWFYQEEIRGRDFVPVYGGLVRQRKSGSIGFDAQKCVSGFDWGPSRSNAWW